MRTLQVATLLLLAAVLSHCAAVETDTSPSTSTEMQAVLASFQSRTGDVIQYLPADLEGIQVDEAMPEDGRPEALRDWLNSQLKPHGLQLSLMGDAASGFWSVGAI